MTMLLLDAESSARENGLFAHPISLRSWLAGDWGLLFSHAEDFARYDMEADRWLVLIRQAFAAARLRPVALERHPDAALHGWITEVNGGARNIALMERRYWPHIADFRPHALREAVQRSRSRFVMFVDDNLQLRRTLFYAPGVQLPSVFDLIAMAHKARLHRGGEAATRLGQVASATAGLRAASG